jgi:hypothetical protein
MINPSEPKKEAVGMPVTTTPATRSTGGRDTVRITLPPSRPEQAPRVVPPPIPATPSSLGPKKETARIAVLPTPASSNTQMRKTQPLISMPEPGIPEVTPVTVAPETAGIPDKMPMALCWTLVGVSAVILIIQILNYIS